MKGVGKKTAERVLLDLRERWSAAGGGAGDTVPLPTGPAGDALRALESLGLERPEAEKRLAALGPEAAKLPVAELVRRALRG